MGSTKIAQEAQTNPEAREPGGGVKRIGKWPSKDMLNWYGQGDGQIIKVIL